jgi:hypothetical protein|tara:strand:- start:1444 stop:2151 length:708 start_codon:yes stop_codon:yes gene_type:complete
MNYEYYWNDIPGDGKCRNNLIYTSLMSEDTQTFCQWFYNDEVYHKGQNEVVDPKLMQEKFDREVEYSLLMEEKYPQHVPEIIDVDAENNKLFLKVDGIDFWNRANCNVENYNSVLPDWQEQMLEILQAYKDLGLYKYSLHPSSYFIVDGKLKSFNHFFCYHKTEGPISIADHASHIYSTRQDIMRTQIETMGISWDEPESLNTLQHLCFESFRKNYTDDFIDAAKQIYNKGTNNC